MEIDKLILKYIWKCQEKKVTIKTNLKRENRFGGITLPHIKIYYKAIIIKKWWHWVQAKRHNRTECPETDSYKYGHLIYYKSNNDK